MGCHYYSTKSALDWIFGHYFFGRKHFTWLADCFFPYNQGNPKSSNPLIIYQDLYQPWKDRDESDKFIVTSRINLRKGILIKETEGLVSSEQGLALRELCDKTGTLFFYPMVYRADINTIPPARREIAGSGLRGSSEYLVKDLGEDEFEVLMLDFDQDSDFKNVVKNAVSGDSFLDSYQVMEILERRR